MKDEKDLELEKPKKKKGVIIGFVLLILIILGLVGYILYDKGIIKLDAKKEKTETKEEVKEKPEETPEELDINSDEVKELVEKYNLTTINLIDGRNLYSIAETGNIKRDLSNLKIDEYSAIIAKSSFVAGNDNADIRTIDEYNSVFKKVFGPDVQVVKYEGKNYCGLITYNKKTNSFEPVGICSGWGDSAAAFTYKATKDNEFIRIQTKAYILANIGDDYPTVELFEFDNASDGDNVITEVDRKTFDATKYADYLDTYEFSFKKASYGKYYFYSVENLKDAKEYTE